MVYFQGDDLFAVDRPRGFPIGNLTSQFWSNVYLTPLDRFVTETLGCVACLRYVDDFALFSDSKRRLYEWKRPIIEFLYTLRLTIHEPQAQVIPCEHGIPWLGFVVYPSHRRIKARNVVKFSRRLRVLPALAGSPGACGFSRRLRVLPALAGSPGACGFSRHLRARWKDHCAGEITFAEFDSSVQGWINHVRYADTWGLRTYVLGQGLVFRKPDS